MSRTTTQFGGLLYTATAILAIGCTQPSSSDFVSDQQIPERQYTIEGMRLEQRADGQVFWRAIAQRASGDLIETAVEDVVFTRLPDGPKDDQISLHSPRGAFQIRKDTATFEEVNIETGEGVHLAAGTARYDGSTTQITVTGPVELTSSGLSVKATNGTVDLERGTIQLTGPIRGVVDLAQTSPDSLSVP